MADSIFDDLWVNSDDGGWHCTYGEMTIDVEGGIVAVKLPEALDPFAVKLAILRLSEAAVLADIQYHQAQAEPEGEIEVSSPPEPPPEKTTGAPEKKSLQEMIEEDAKAEDPNWVWDNTMEKWVRA